MNTTITIKDNNKNYGFFHFIWDCIMVVATFGLWFIWIFVREMRRR